MKLSDKLIAGTAFEVGAQTYQFDKNGVLFQLNPHPIEYDNKYIEERYNQYGELGPRMAHLRLGYLLGVLGKTPTSLLDVGYGNGDFLRAAATVIPNVTGNDHPPMYPIDPINTVENIYRNYYDVVSFFDVLEHFNDPYQIRELRCKYIIISVPNLVLDFSELEFKEWKHRRPNEHLAHFSQAALKKFFLDIGFECIAQSHIEDSIRKNHAQAQPNIATSVYEKIS